MKNKIGIGLVTYNRPKYFDKSSKAIANNLLDVVDRFVVYNDGSEVSYQKGYQWLERLKSDKIKIIDNPENNGVAYAKNRLFEELMKDCEYIFIVEDDIIPQSRQAIVMYLAAAKMTGIDHLMFAHHGPGNAQPDSCIGQEGPVLFWKAGVGAWTFYTRNILQKVGLMDENFRNAWEHVEHTWRITKYHKLPYGYYPDVMDSQKWLKEIPGSIENSSIGQQDDPKRIRIIIDGLQYWKQKDKDFPAQHTLDLYNKILKEMLEDDFNTTTN